MAAGVQRSHQLVGAGALADRAARAQPGGVGVQARHRVLNPGIDERGRAIFKHIHARIHKPVEPDLFQINLENHPPETPPWRCGRLR